MIIAAFFKVAIGLGIIASTTASTISPNVERAEKCSLEECIGAVAKAIPGIVACADAVKELPDAEKNPGPFIGEATDCLAEMVATAVEIPTECGPCAQEISEGGLTTP